MWSAIVGDFIGSHYEHIETKGYDLPFLKKDSTITDDSILMAATVDSVMNKISFATSYRKWAKKYPDVGYGPGFSSWLQSDPDSSGYSFGNGAAVRSIPLAYMEDDLKTLLFLAEESASCSHSHPEGINGAKATCLAIHRAKHGSTFNDIATEMQVLFDYLLFYDLDDLHKNFGFDSSAENTVPIAIFIGFNAKSFEDCVRKCLYVGGDVDTITSIACAIAEARGLLLDLPEVEAKCKENIINRFPELYDIILNYDKNFKS